MAFSDLLCHMARSPALAVTVLLTLAVLVVNGWTDAPNAIAGVVVSGALPFPAAAARSRTGRKKRKGPEDPFLHTQRGCRPTVQAAVP